MKLDDISKVALVKFCTNPEYNFQVIFEKSVQAYLDKFLLEFISRNRWKNHWIFLEKLGPFWEIYEKVFKKCHVEF